MNNINNLKPFPRFCVTLGMLPSSYKESLTYEEQLLWLCNYIETEVIPKYNENVEAINELITLYNQLKEYVDNYFENLDVQEEINNKLDDMAESGELEEIIGAYINLKSLLMYDTIADLKAATNLADGSFAKTLGYYNKLDKGGSNYKIREIINTDVVDDVLIVGLTNFPELVAELIIDKSFIYVDQFGSHGDGSTDDTEAIQKAINYGATHNLKVMFNNKTYVTSEALIIKEVSNISGVNTNDEYYSGSTIKNTSSNIIDLEADVVGAHIENLRFESDENEELYFLNNRTYSLKWCEIKNCGFQKFYKVFNCLTLGCRFEKLWINGGKSAGSLSGSDNTFTDSFIGAPLANGEDLITFSGYGLSRLNNLYFTGKTSNNTGNNNIVKIGGYCNNLDFNGCYFDFSNGAGITIIGEGNDFPNSGATNINLIGCLFRGNCCDLVNTKHIININYARNINITNCSFSTQDRYTVNPNSKIYNIDQYGQAVSLTNNFYDTPFSKVENAYYLSNTQINEMYDHKYANLGINYYSNTLRTTFNENSTQKIYRIRTTKTTGATYGEISFTLPESFGDNPIVHADVVGSTYVATINSITSNSVQLVIRNIANGAAVVNTSVDVSLTVCNF